MENPVKTYNKSEATTNANNPSHYWLMIVGVFVSVLGALLRFAGNGGIIDTISNLVLVIGVILCLKAVTNILK